MPKHEHQDDQERQAIADELGPPWHYVPANKESVRPFAHIPQIVDGEGHNLYLSAETRGKWHVSGFFPQMPDSGAVYAPYAYGASPGDYGYETINVGRAKTPAQIARDIERRFLPGYLKAFAACADKLALTMAAIRDRDAVLSKVAALFGQTWTPHNRNRAGEENLMLYFDGNPGSVRVSTFDGSTVSVKLDNLTPEQIHEVLKVTHQAKFACAVRRNPEGGTISAM